MCVCIDKNENIAVNKRKRNNVSVFQNKIVEMQRLQLEILQKRIQEVSAMRVNLNSKKKENVKKKTKQSYVLNRCKTRNCHELIDDNRAATVTKGI